MDFFLRVADILDLSTEEKDALVRSWLSESRSGVGACIALDSEQRESAVSDSDDTDKGAVPQDSVEGKQHTSDNKCSICTYQLPEGKIIAPGVVTHSTNLIEHPELVAERIMLFAERVGKENVIAGTDCGMGARIHPELGWAKLEALAEGARLATRRLWGR